MLKTPQLFGTGSGLGKWDLGTDKTKKRKTKQKSLNTLAGKKFRKTPFGISKQPKRHHLSINLSARLQQWWEDIFDPGGMWQKWDGPPKWLKEMARISELQDGGQALVSRAGFHTGFSCVKSEHTAHKSNSTLVLTVGSLSHKAVINQRGKVLLLRTGRPPKLDPALPYALVLIYWAGRISGG